MTGRVAFLLALAAALGALPLATPSPATAQTHAHAAAVAPSHDPRLGRLDPATRAAVGPLLDTAQRVGLPTEPLVDKALEGSGKHADGARIVTAVRQLAAELTLSRAALGFHSSHAELRAAAHMVHAGATAAQLGALRRAGGKRSLTLPLTTASDLVAHGVPVDTALRLITALTARGAHEQDFTSLRRNVRLDVEPGADPATSASVRGNGMLVQLDSARVKQR